MAVTLKFRVTDCDGSKMEVSCYTLDLLLHFTLSVTLYIYCYTLDYLLHFNLIVTLD